MGSKDTIFTLSGEEVQLLSDVSFFTRKKNLTGRIMELMGHMEASYEQICMRYRSLIPDPVFNRRGKISRGENYKGLPYIILDYPALFSKEGIFAYRSLMWWGHPFSFTFHISGIYLDQHFDKLMKALPAFSDQTRICINESQWEHHHFTSNYIPVKEFMQSDKFTDDYFRKTKFLKLSQVIPLEEHHLIQSAGTEFLKEILQKLT